MAYCAKKIFKRLFLVIVFGFVRASAISLLGVYLQRSPWFVTPWNSAKRLKEAIYLFNASEEIDEGDPYSGDRIHLLPIYVKLFSAANNADLFIYMYIWAFADFGAAYYLMYFVRGYIRMATLHSSFSAKQECIEQQPKEKNEREQEKFQKNDDEQDQKETDNFRDKETTAEEMAELALLIYLFNPMSIGFMAVHSISTFTNLCVALALLLAFNGFPAIAGVFVSIATSLYPHYVVLLIPLLICANECGSLRSVLRTLGAFFLTTAVIFAYSFSVVNNPWYLFHNTIGFFFSYSDLTPNVGLYWYFFTEVFPHYRLFFKWVFQINSFVYALPFACLFRNNWPLLWVQLLIHTALLSPYPSVAEAALYIPLLLVFVEFHDYLRYSFIVTITFIVTLTLMPVTWYMWVISGTGNANFFFAMTLVYNFAQVFLSADFTSAYLRSELVRRYADGDLAKMEKNYEGIELISPLPPYPPPYQDDKEKDTTEESH